MGYSLIVMHGCSRMSLDLRIPAMPWAGADQGGVLDQQAQWAVPAAQHPLEKKQK